MACDNTPQQAVKADSSPFLHKISERYSSHVWTLSFPRNALCRRFRLFQTQTLLESLGCTCKKVVKACKQWMPSTTTSWLGTEFYQIRIFFSCSFKTFQIASELAAIECHWSHVSLFSHFFCWFFMPSLGRCHMPLKISQTPQAWHDHRHDISDIHGNTWNIRKHHGTLCGIFSHISNKIGELATTHLDVRLGLITLVELKCQHMPHHGRQWTSSEHKPWNQPHRSTW